MFALMNIFNSALHVNCDSICMCCMHLCGVVVSKFAFAHTKIVIKVHILSSQPSEAITPSASSTLTMRYLTDQNIQDTWNSVQETVSTIMHHYIHSIIDIALYYGLAEGLAVAQPIIARKQNGGSNQCISVNTVIISPCSKMLVSTSIQKSLYRLPQYTVTVIASKTY